MNLIFKYFNKYSIYICIVLIIVIFLFIYLYLNKECINNCIYDELSSVKEKIEEVRNEYYYVDIKGEVVNNGVYKVDSDSRIIDVINLAGGLTDNADISLLNLSKKIIDEMNIKIYSKEEVNSARTLKEESCEPVVIKESCEPEIVEVIKEIEKECECSICRNDATIVDSKILENSESVDITENKLININSATMEELMTISGIGESKAKSIIEYRSVNLFVSIEDIMNVSGIGTSLFEKVKDYITV